MPWLNDSPCGFITSRLLLKTTLAVRDCLMAQLAKCHCTSLKPRRGENCHWLWRGIGRIIFSRHLEISSTTDISLILFLLNKLTIKNPFEIFCKFFYLSPTEKKKKKLGHIYLFSMLIFISFPIVFLSFSLVCEHMNVCSYVGQAYLPSAGILGVHYHMQQWSTFLLIITFGFILETYIFKYGAFWNAVLGFLNMEILHTIALYTFLVK